MLYLQQYQPIALDFDLSSLRTSTALRTKKYKTSTYYGELRSNAKEGLGVMLYQDGKVYEGQWKADKKEGQGAERLANTALYIGQF